MAKQFKHSPSWNALVQCRRGLEDNIEGTKKFIENTRTTLDQQMERLLYLEKELASNQRFLDLMEKQFEEAGEPYTEEAEDQV